MSAVYHKDWDRAYQLVNRDYDRRFRRDKCRKCGGDLWVLKWAKVKPRTCYGCIVKYRAAKAALKEGA